MKVCGEEMKIRGYIDRIDHHPEHGWAILDYKSGDNPLTPGDVYGRLKGWKDLPLPLYQHLASELELEGEVKLGYSTIPRDTSLIPAWMGDWDESVLSEADEVAADVIHRVRAGEWFKTGTVPRYDPITQAVFGVGLLTGDVQVEGEEGTA